MTIIVSVVAIVLAAFAMWQARKAGQPLTTELLQGTLATATTQAQELTDVALTAAQAAEQLWRTGKIAKGERLNTAFNYARKWFPDLDQATIVTAIEAGVLVVNSIVDALPKSDSTPSGTDPAPPPPYGTYTGRTP